MCVLRYINPGRQVVKRLHIVVEPRIFSCLVDFFGGGGRIAYFCIFIFCAPKFAAPGESAPFAIGSDSSFLHSANDIGVNVPHLDVRSATFSKLDSVDKDGNPITGLDRP